MTFDESLKYKDYYAEAILNNDFEQRVRIGIFPTLEEAKKAFLVFLKENQKNYSAISSLYGAIYRNEGGKNAWVHRKI